MRRRSPESEEVQRLLDGPPALRRAVAGGSIPIAVETLLEAQAALYYRERDDPESEEAELARRSLLDTSPDVLSSAFEAASAPRLAEFCLRLHSDTDLRIRALRHRALEPWILAEVAETVGPHLQRALVQRQDAMQSEPQILKRLRANPDLDPEVARRVDELEKLAATRRAAREREGEEEIAAASEEEAEAEIEEVRDQEPQKGEVDDQTLLSEGQVRLLSPQVKMRLCSGAGTRLRNFLVRDTNPVIAKAALKMSAFTASEIERIARSRMVQEEVLEMIANDRNWARKYPVKRALVSNPKTPVGIALRMLPGVAPRDLKNLRLDRNISDAVRSRARQLYRVRVG